MDFFSLSLIPQGHSIFGEKESAITAIIFLSVWIHRGKQ